jgi:hypothetical protein
LFCLAKFNSSLKTKTDEWINEWYLGSSPSGPDAPRP